MEKQEIALRGIFDKYVSHVKDDGVMAVLISNTPLHDDAKNSHLTDYDLLLLDIMKHYEKRNSQHKAS